MKTVFSFLFLTFFAWGTQSAPQPQTQSSAAAQAAFENSCRLQAKEIAVQTYDACVTNAKNQQIEQIRKEYQDKLNELKNFYNGELKKISGENSNSNSQNSNGTQAKAKSDEVSASAKSKPNKKSGKAEVPTSGIAKSLPAKQNNNGEAAPIQQFADNQPVVEISTAATKSNKSSLRSQAPAMKESSHGIEANQAMDPIEKEAAEMDSSTESEINQVPSPSYE